ncbi:MAG: carboxypeptidase-like regulatory domain-containing protein [Bacteroidetes bacterium]|nr:carboxypeptidase-like regulatory domain-containing protein [Bacteroidota bacterium]
MAFICCCLTLSSYSQHRQVRGNVTNPFTKERVSFASVMWKNARNGTITDSAGNFSIPVSAHKLDTLVISYSGFIPLYVRIDPAKDTALLQLFLTEGKRADSAIVKSGYNKGYLWWKKVVKNRPHNDPYEKGSGSYELYNKLELDINNIRHDAFDGHRMLKPFGFILNNIDSVSERSPFLPVFITERLASYYFSNDPSRSREEVKAVQTNGIRNEMVLHYLEGLHSRSDSYENYFTLFGKEFISPMGSLGEKYYNYRGADTQYISGQRYLHLFFSPKREGENTFSGDCWIHHSTWAIKKVNLSVSATAGINYVKRLDLIQEFAQKNDSAWTLSRDKCIVELSPLKKDQLSIIARKTDVYRPNSGTPADITEQLKKNTQKQEVVVEETATEKDQLFWQTSRLEPLSSSEQKVYKMIDTLKSMPLFNKYVHTVELIVDGHKKFGKVEIGPWYRWISGNQREKLRLRFDLATTEAFSRQLRLHSYLAYGFGDRAFKGKADATYRFPGKSGYTLQASYLHDLDNGRARYNDEDPTMDNMFSRLIRRNGIKQKFLQIDEIKASVTKEWTNDLSAQLSISRSSYETFNPLPPKQTLALNQQDLTSTEAGLKLRYAPGENKVSTFRKNIRFTGSHPVFETRYAVGIPGLLGGRYSYQKASASITQNFRLPRWGKIDYRVYGGKVFSNALPFMLLELHPGNEVYYYNKQAFNLMNRFEYFSDRYAGFNIEHNFEKKLLNLIPFMRPTHMRQFWNIKAVWGTLSPENKQLNCMTSGSYRLRSLNGKAYIEAGTGFDNIFKYFRVDAVWRFSPEADSNPRFGIFGSMHVQF